MNPIRWCDIIEKKIFSPYCSICINNWNILSSNLGIIFQSTYDYCHDRILDKQQYNQWIIVVYRQEIRDECNYDDIHRLEVDCWLTFLTTKFKKDEILHIYSSSLTYSDRQTQGKINKYTPHPLIIRQKNDDMIYKKENTKEILSSCCFFFLLC
jgi:hypothetical protein